METNKMTIHRGLAELKLIDKRISNKIESFYPVGIYQEGKNINGLKSQDDFKGAAESDYDSILALIKRKQAIKNAIVHANATTDVTIGEETMTIADAINYKTILVLKKQLGSRMHQVYKSTVADRNKRNDLVNQNVQNILEATFGKDNTKVSESDIDAVQKPYLTANEFHLFDPLKIEDKMEKLSNSISDFETEIDAVLSEINSTTIITIQ